MWKFLWDWPVSARPRHRRKFTCESLETRVLLSATNYGPKSTLARWDQPVIEDDGDQLDDDHSHTVGIVDENGGELIHEPPEPAELVSSESLPDQIVYAPLDQTFKLHSLPGALHTIYLDFDGHITQGTTWNASSGISTIDSPAYDPDGNGATFTTNELQRIQRIWQRVAEDFAPFNINVTTEDPGTEALRKSGSGDQAWGVRVVITPDDWDNCDCGGFAYINSFNDSVDEPVFVFNTSEIGVSGAISHEVGHSLGLSHDGTSTTSYYNGHGTGETGWGPIMGSGYYENVTTWDTGQYFDTNNGSSSANYNKGADDFRVITTYNGFGYRIDDHPDSIGSGTELSVLSTGTSSQSVQSFGRIETGSDIDWFAFTAAAGSVDLTINSYFVEAYLHEVDGTFTQTYMDANFSQGSNLDVQAWLYDSSGAVITTANPASSLSSILQATIAAGTYYVAVAGVGFGNWSSNPPSGYGDVASVGEYLIQGTIPGVPAGFNAKPTLDPLAPIALEENSGPVNVSLTGISAGSAEIQPLRISAMSTDLTLIPDVTIDYSSGASTGQLTFTPASNESGTATITIFVEDAGLDLDFNTTTDNQITTRALQVSVTAVNHPPRISNQTFGVVQSSSAGTLVGQILATDNDSGQSLTYAVLSATDSRSFNVDPTTGVITVNRWRSIRSTGTQQLQVRVTDSGNPALSADATITINVVNSNTPGTVVINPLVTSLAENTQIANKLQVASLSVVDDGIGSNILGLAGPDASYFELDGHDLYLRPGSEFDYESMSSLNVSVTVDDPTLSGAVNSSIAFNFQVLDVNEAPTDLLLVNAMSMFSENANTSSRQLVAELLVVDDALGNYTFTLSGADASFFEVIQQQLFLKAGMTLDATNNPVLDVTVSVDDQGVGSAVDAQASLSIDVVDVPVNHAPDINDQSFSIARRSSSGTVVGQVVATDSDNGQQLTFEIISGSSDMFSVNATTGVITVDNRRNTRNTGIYQIVVRVTDDGNPALSAEATMTIHVV